MKKKYKVTAIVLAFLLATFGTFTTWGMMSAIASNQEKIIEQQTFIITQQGDLLDLLEDTFEQLSSKPMSTDIGLELHVDMWHYRNGKLLEYSHHAGTLTNIGADWIEEKLGVDAGSTIATRIALSNSASSPSAAWEDLPEEITTGNMSRAVGTYVSTGTGTWNVSYTFSPTETNSTQLVGLLWDAGATKLLAADTITQINYQSGDTVQITWMVTAS